MSCLKTRLRSRALLMGVVGAGVDGLEGCWWGLVTQFLIVGELCVSTSLVASMSSR
jgi:hypothetical protein